MAVAAANFPFLLGITNPDPALIYSKLGTHLGSQPLPGMNYVDPNVGITAQALGHLAAMDWLRGHVPWWNPYEGFGSPLAGEMQSAAFFPLVLVDALANGQILFRIVLEAVAGCSAYLLLRRLVTSTWAATAGGVAFALNGTFAWMFHAPSNPVAFAPMLLLGLEQAREKPRSRLSGWPVIAFAVALSIYAGFPEVAYIDGLLCLIWLVLRASDLRGRDLLLFLGRVARGVGCGLLLAAPLIVAFVDYLPYANVGAHGTGFGHSHLGPSAALPQMLLPYVFGPLYAWTTHTTNQGLYNLFANVGGYAGASLIFLALLGLFGATHRRLRISLAVWILLAVGRTTGLAFAPTIINAIPLVKNTAFYRYSPPSVSLALTILAAFGIDDLARRRSRVRVLATGAIMLGLVAWAGRTAVTGALRSVVGVSSAHRWADWSITGAVLIVVALSVAGMLRSGRSRCAVMAVVLAMESMALFVIPTLSVPSSGVIDTGTVSYLRGHLGSDRFLTFGPISSNYGSYWQVSSLNANDVPTPKLYDEYWDGPVDAKAFPGKVTAARLQIVMQHLPAIENAGVGYLLLPPGTSVPPSDHLTVEYQDEVATVVKVPDAAPLLSVSGGKCHLLASDVSSATASCQAPGTLIYRELYMPGWSASDNGHRASDRPYTNVFQAVSLHLGLNRVTLNFRPPHSSWAELGLVIGLLVIITSMILRSRPSAADPTPDVPAPDVPEPDVPEPLKRAHGRFARSEGFEPPTSDP